MKGKSHEIKKISDRLIGTKGVKHGKLTMTTTGKELEQNPTNCRIGSLPYRNHKKRSAGKFRCITTGKMLLFKKWVEPTYASL